MGIRIPTGRRQTSWLFTSVVEDLNSGLLRTDPASGRAGLELGAIELQVQRSNRSVTPCLSFLPQEDISRHLTGVINGLQKFFNNKSK